MNEVGNVKAQFVQELAVLRARVSELEHETMEHKKVEQELQESEERFHKIFDYSNDAIFIIDPAQDEILVANPRACSMLQYSRQELLSTPISAVHPKEMPQLLAFAQSVFEQGRGWTDELTCLTKSGETLPAEISASVIEMAGKNCIVAMVRDITERKRAQAALRESEKRFRDLYEEAPNAYFSVGTDGTIRRVNRSAVELLGYPLNQLVGRRVLDLSADTPAGKVRIQENFLKFLAGQEIRGEEIEFRKADGRPLWISLSVRPVLDAHGKVLESRSIVVDITERKRVEQALRESEEKFRRLVEQAADAFFVHDFDGKIIDVNQRACDSLGYTREELLKLWVADIEESFGAEEIAETCKRMVPGIPLTIAGSERRKDGTIFPVEVRVGLFESSGHRLILALARDITERKRAEAALRESEDRLARILESAMDAIITVDQARRIALFNNAAEKVFRCPAAQAIGQSIDRFLSERFRRLLEESVHNVDRNGGKKHCLWAPAGLMARRFDGEEFPIEATLSRVEVAGKKLLTVILRDINERQRAELELQKLQLEKVYLQEVIKSESDFGEIVGSSPSIKKVFRSVEQVAATDSTVLITGETGTGKELIARTLHNLSRRRNNVLVRVNCAALPPGLIESELFGHEKGAFTGALSRKIGRFELANRGAIFLDEIGELPVELQVKLLRVLQEGEFERVGGSHTFKVDVRVIAATNRDLEKAIQQDKFRLDLYYRLNVFPIQMPPLRERKGDIQLLTEYFVSKHSKKVGKAIETIPTAALDALLAYPWPGNVRELENVIERAVIITQGPQLELGEWLPRPIVSPPESRFLTLEEGEREHILEALELTGWQVSGKKGAALHLGLKPTTLEARMKKLGIKRK
ncbi:MAG: PAS domain S-box protein [Acidobacteria bacterium]|nr:PAS domain S-box protein [Acidobacteriota bacterium]